MSTPTTKVRPRVIPCLLLQGRSLVKTVGFKKGKYIGDPINTVRIYDEMEVDELCFLDISATPEDREPKYALLEEIAAECFMPFAYGGGVRNVEQMARLYALGAEKVSVNTAAYEDPRLLRRAADRFGSQSVVVAIDAAKRRWFGGWEVVTHGGRKRRGCDVVSWAKEAVRNGAGEILLTSVNNDGAMGGYDLDLVRAVTAAVDVPVIACGGAGTLEDCTAVVVEGGAQAAAAGSMVVYQRKNRSVLVNYPTKRELREAFSAAYARQGSQVSR